MRIILYGTTAGCEKVRTYLDDFELHIYTHMEQLIPALIERIPDAVFSTSPQLLQTVHFYIFS